MDVSAEDNSTFEPRLYQSAQQQRQAQQRQQHWMLPDTQLDVLLQRLQQTAAQAWDAYRRQRDEGLTERASTDFLARRAS